MSEELKCVDCGNPVCDHVFCPNCEEDKTPECDWNAYGALEKAQRSAAIAHLRAIVKQRDSFNRPSVGWNRLDNELWAAIAAYRAIGVLPKERKP